MILKNTKMIKVFARFFRKFGSFIYILTLLKGMLVVGQYPTFKIKFTFYGRKWTNYQYWPVELNTVHI